ncbi:hypothetical protein AVEN_56209-1 [Araneus ventricosus]|uniref:Uncharacterized protein n=1 Tax=Araneus ventricosus TaxID=182803 RepID=A0A4Y2P206_ARAVE|nr:hypothetical protein AVEN_56209-1 [Araneus ventricosus]
MPFVIKYDDLNGVFNGSLCDRENDGISFLNLRVSINLLFAEHNVGILIAAGSAYGIMYYDNFYFTYSHSCGPKETAEHKMEKPVSSNAILLRNSFVQSAELCIPKPAHNFQLMPSMLSSKNEFYQCSNI